MDLRIFKLWPIMSAAVSMANHKFTLLLLQLEIEKKQ